MMRWRPAAVMVFTSLWLLGCAGFLEEPPEDTEEEEDTAEVAAYEDTAERKAAKQARRRKKRLANQPKKPTTGTLTVKVKPGSVYTAVEVSCTENGYRKRCNFANNQCALAGVSLFTETGCRAFFQGGDRASWGPVKGGTTLSCSFNGQVANCSEG